MKTRKLFAGLMAAATAATMAASVIVTAAETVGVKISNATVKAGEVFTLTVDLSDIPSAGMNGLDFGISYDSSIVTVDSVTKGSIVAEVPSDEQAVSDPLTTSIDTSGVISVIYGVATTDSSYYLKDSGTFLTITGTVSPDAQAGEKSEFKIVPNERNTTPSGTTKNSDTYFGLIDADDNITVYTPTITDGYVLVAGDTEETDPTDEPTDAPTDAPTIELGEASLYGDVDCNGSVEIADVVTLNQYLLDNTAHPLEAQGLANADVEKDNVIDISDSSKLINCLAELIDQSELGKG